MNETISGDSGRAIRQVGRGEVVAIIAPVVTSYILYLIWHRLIMAGSTSDVRTLLMLVATLAGVIGFRNRRYSDLPDFLALFVRVIGLFVLGQVCFDAVNFSPGAPTVLSLEGSPLAWCAQIIGLAAAVLAITRPAFVIVSLAYYIAWRSSLYWRIGIPDVSTDYLGMADAGLFGAIGGIFLLSPFAERLTAVVYPSLSSRDGTEKRRLRIASCSLLWAVMVGAHLRNYLYSGIAKISAGQDQPLTWLLHNSTQNSILIGLERGDNPLSHLPWLLQGIWDGMAFLGPVLNAVVLAAQLFAPLGALNRRTLVLLAVFYDLFHVFVYLTLGALFFFWIVMNILVVVTVKRLPEGRMTPLVSITMLAAMLLSAGSFYTNKLGWLDGPKLASTEFLAQTKDGRAVPIPGPFFGIYAYNIAQGAMYIPPGSFPLRVGGNTRTLEDWKDAMSCGDKLIDKPGKVSFASVGSMVEATDTFARRHPWFKSLNTYYLYPHHMVPNPWDFQEFNGLKMSDIVGYVYRVDSVCLSLDHGHLRRQVKRRWQATFPATSVASTTPVAAGV